MGKEEMVQNIELQIHDQFSKTYYNGFNSTIAIFSMLFAVLTGYGYVFIHSDAIFRGIDNMSLFASYSLDALVFAAIAANIVLCIIKYVCLCKGVSLRLEQFIVYAIRKKFYLDMPEKCKPRVFPVHYHPFGKDGNDIVIGLYGKFISILCGIQMLVLASLLGKLIKNYLTYKDNEFRAEAFLELFFLYFVVTFCYAQFQSIKQEQFSRYKRIAKQYIIDIKN